MIAPMLAWLRSRAILPALGLLLGLGSLILAHAAGARSERARTRRRSLGAAKERLDVEDGLGRLDDDGRRERLRAWAR